MVKQSAWQFCLMAESAEIGEGADIRSHTVIYGQTTIGNNFRTGHSALIRENCEIGDNVVVGSHSEVGHHCKIGNNVTIHSGVFVPEYTVIEDDVFIGPGAILTNAKYPRSEGVKERLKGPHIKKGAIVGAGVVILPGVVIGERALAGAGSVVTHPVPDGFVVAGNPAKFCGLVKDIPYYAENSRSR